jgi:NADH:ubiquinone oxidoreductase subunit K
LIEIEHVLVVGGILFSIGLYVALSRRNGVGILMGVELMLNAVNVNLIGFARLTESPSPVTGQVFSVFVITVAAAEAAVALALAVSVYRYRQSIDVDKLDLLKW